MQWPPRSSRPSTVVRASTCPCTQWPPSGSPTRSAGSRLTAVARPQGAEGGAGQGLRRQLHRGPALAAGDDREAGAGHRHAGADRQALAQGRAVAENEPRLIFRAAVAAGRPPGAATLQGRGRGRAALAADSSSAGSGSASTRPRSMTSPVNMRPARVYTSAAGSPTALVPLSGAPTSYFTRWKWKVLGIDLPPCDIVQVASK